MLKQRVPQTCERFMVITNFFRNFIPQFAKLSKGLYAMAKSKELSWCEELLSNFLKIKTAE